MPTRDEKIKQFEYDYLYGLIEKGDKDFPSTLEAFAHDFTPEEQSTFAQLWVDRQHLISDDTKED